MSSFTKLCTATAATWAVGLCFVAASAGAQPASGVSMSYEAPAECPGQPDVTAALERLLGDAVRQGPPMVARGHVTKTATGDYHLVLDLDREGARSRRDLDSKSCDTLAETAALLTALSHDPEAVERMRTAPPPPAPPPVEPPVPQPAIVVPVPAAPPPLPPLRSPPELGFVARIGPVFAIADLPDAHAGFMAAVALRLDEYTVEGAFELGIGSTGTLDGRPDAGADFTRIVGIVRGCRVFVPFFDAPWPRGLGHVDLSACAAFELGILSGEGFGVTRPQRGEAFWFAPRLDLRLGVGLVGPLSLSADVGVAFPVDRRRFVILGASDETLVVHEPGPAAGRLGATLELQL